jgi:hypothetical protein
MVHEIARDVRRRVDAEMPAAKEPVVKAVAGAASFEQLDELRKLRLAVQLVVSGQFVCILVCIL